MSRGRCKASEARILAAVAYVEAHPGAEKEDVRRHLRVLAPLADSTLRRAVARGMLRKEIVRKPHGDRWPITGGAGPRATYYTVEVSDVD